MHGPHFLTCPAIRSSHTLLLLHHIHCYYFIPGNVSTSSHALVLLQHTHCSHFITEKKKAHSHNVPPAGLELTITDLGFSSTQKEKEKRHSE